MGISRHNAAVIAILEQLSKHLTSQAISTFNSLQQAESVSAVCVKDGQIRALVDVIARLRGIIDALKVPDKTPPSHWEFFSKICPRCQRGMPLMAKRCPGCKHPMGRKK